jgi:Neocarzinostatin family
VRLRVCVVLTLAAVALWSAVAPAGAQTQEPTITVTPNTGLVDGQVVSLTGTGFADISSIAGLECPPQFGGRTEFTINEVLSSCGFVAFAGEITTDATGNVTGSATVREVFETSGGATTYDCTVRNDCVLLVAGLVSGAELRGATAPVQFGPATPATRAACKNGGWRSLANDQGQPFRNQGQCVSYANGRR